MAIQNKNKRHGPDPVVRGKRVMIALALIFIALIFIMFGFAHWIFSCRTNEDYLR